MGRTPALALVHPTERDMDLLRQDLVYAWRSLRRAKGLVVTCVLSLALGLGASTVLFSVVDAALLRPPPFPEPDRLALLTMKHRSPAEGETAERWSWSRFELLRTSVHAFEKIAAYSNAVLAIRVGDGSEAVPMEVASADYVHVAGFRLLLGRDFVRDDELEGAPPVAILGHELWATRFRADSAIVGQRIQVNGVSLVVVGVAARGFSGVSGRAQAWISPAAATRVSYRDYLRTNQNFISVVGRLRPGESVDDARRELRVLGTRIEAAIPAEDRGRDDAFSATALSLNEARADVTTRRALALLSVAVGLLLLLACANVASLLLGRAEGRRREMAIRLAIGAGRGRLVRQLLVECALIAGAACVIAIVAAVWVLPLVSLPPTLARGRNFYGAIGEFATPVLGVRVFAFAAATCAATVLAFGLLPALRATRADLAGDLKTSAAAVRSGRRLDARDWAVALQVALALTLLVGGGMMLASFQRLRSAPLGFDPSNLLTFMLRPSEVAYAGARAPQLIDRVLDEIQRVPGVVSATVDGCAPVSMQCAVSDLHIIGRDWGSAEPPLVRRHYVAAAHFATLRTPILRGRGLTDEDRAGSRHVVVINEEAARRYWPNQDPIGKRVWFDAAAGFASPDSAAEVVGVVENTAYGPIDETPIYPDFFTAYRQFTYPTRMVLIRTRHDPLSIVRDVGTAIRRVDPNLALFDVQSMEARAGTSWAKRAFETWLLAAFALVAAALATIGVFAVTAYAVASRHRELGVRIALGASSFRILEAAASRTGRLAIVGLVAGALGAAAMSGLLRAFLYATSPMDPVVLAAVGVATIMVLGLATLVPARRALRVQPVDVLRSD
jgi:predicted permease